jgi:transcriptional regulator with XRE-family HTH domain
METAVSFRLNPRTVLPDSGHGVPARERIATVLRGLGLSAKQLARHADRTPKAVERWMQAENDMTVESLLRLCRDFDEVWDEVRIMCGRANDASEAERLLAEFAERLRSRRARDAA